MPPTSFMYVCTPVVSNVFQLCIPHCSPLWNVFTVPKERLHALAATLHFSCFSPRPLVPPPPDTSPPQTPPLPTCQQAATPLLSAAGGSLL